MANVAQHLLSDLDDFVPQLVVFDKGGTLIDFRGMWSRWAIELARRLDSATGMPMAGRLFDGIGFDPRSQWIDPDGSLARASMANLRVHVTDLLCEAGLSRQSAEAAMAVDWFAPDPVTDVCPFADVAALFAALQDRGVKVAVATMDDRAPTETTLAHLGAARYVDVLICADDGLTPKPAPDMVLAACRALGVEPARAMVVGDAVTDMQMGRSAGAGMVVGVLSGVAMEDMLASEADVLLSSVADLI